MDILQFILDVIIKIRDKSHLGKVQVTYLQIGISEKFVTLWYIRSHKCISLF